MSLVNISKAFDKAIANMPNGLGANKTSFENDGFKPKNDEPYQAVRLVSADPENPTLGDNYHRQVGYYQIILFYPSAKGAGAARNQAEIIKEYFYRSKSLVEGDTVVNILRTPTIAPAYIEDNRYCIPIRISYYTNEF